MVLASNKHDARSETIKKPHPMLHLTRTILSAALVLLMTGPSLAKEPVGLKPDNHRESGKLHDPSRICAKAITPIERIGGFPSQLLQAIALTESGRWDKGRRVRFA